MEAVCRRMVLVCGTSTCHMAVSRDKLFIPGVWGPFWSGTNLCTSLLEIKACLSLEHHLGTIAKMLTLRSPRSLCSRIISLPVLV